MNKKQLKKLKTWVQVGISCLLLAILPLSLALGEGQKAPVPLPQDVSLTAMIATGQAGKTLGLFTQPDESSQLLGEYYNGTPLYITKETSDTWLGVTIGDGEGARRGYMKRAYLTLTFTVPDERKEERFSTDEMSEYLITTDKWKLYNQMDEKGGNKTFDRHYVVQVMGVVNKWSHVMVSNVFGEAGNYTMGFVPTKELKIAITRGVINNNSPDDRLHLRTKASSKGDSMGKYYNGTQVFLLNYEKDKTWAKVYIPSMGIGGYEGYMDTTYIATGPARKEVEEVFPVITVNNPGDAGNIKLREMPKDSATILDRYPNGTHVEVMGLTQSWYHVKVDGKVGFMLAKFLEPQISFDYKK